MTHIENELRAHLDLGYTRERGLFAALRAARSLLEGAAVAKDKEDQFQPTLALIDSALQVVTRPRAPVLGLLVNHAVVQAQKEAAVVSNNGLQEELRAAAKTIADLRTEASQLAQHVRQLEAEKSALLRLIQDDEVAERVMEAGRQLMEKPR